ncbi:MAG: cytochrome c [Gammaproteobacteria bacterium]|nr:cytochrome c [Gammaproteobacteria bacterium]
MMKEIIVLTSLYLMTTVSFAESTARWFTIDQVNQGGALFKQNCAVCHGQNAEATADWKTTDANGNYPPPPLNGTAHAWHHGLDLLKTTVREGGQKLGGVMPPFADKLSDNEMDMVIAYFQSKWADDIYQKWAGRFEKNQPVFTQ